MHLSIIYDENNKLKGASINWELPGFDKLVVANCGKDWDQFVMDVMYLNYSSRRFENELKSLSTQHVVDNTTPNQVAITFTNSMVRVVFQLPNDYPRVGEWNGMEWNGMEC